MSDLINEYKQSISDKNRAKMVIALSSVCLIAFFSLIGINSAKSFAKNAVPEISQKVSNLVLANSDQYLEVAKKSSSNILPIYTANLQEALEKEWPIIEKEIAKEMNDLNSFAQQKYPKLKQELFEMALSQEETLEKELNKILSKEKSEEISNSYSLAALNAYKSFVKSNFSKHEKQAVEIANSLGSVVHSEPDVPENVSLNEVIGLSMQVIGKELVSVGR